MDYYLENATGEKCPEGTRNPPIRNPLPLVIVKNLKPIFDKLESKKNLVNCENVCTQFLNECYRLIVGSLTPKKKFNSAYEIKFAVDSAIQLFNKRYSKMCFLNKEEEKEEEICSSVGIKVTQNVKIQW